MLDMDTPAWITDLERLRVVVRCARCHRRLTTLGPGAGPPGGPYGPVRPFGAGTVVPEGAPQIYITDGSGGEKPRRAAVRTEDVSQPDTGSLTEPTRYRYTCTHRNGRRRQVTITLARLRDLYADAVKQPRPVILI
jgi:hypothetical protein